MKKVILVSLLFFIILLSSETVSADMGPKPELTIIINGLNEKAVVDLLVDEESGGYNNCSSLWDVDFTNYYNKLDDFQKSENMSLWELDGHNPVGCITEVSDNNIFNFSYRVPTDFKIVILTESDKLIVTDMIHKRMFQSSMTFDISDESELVQRGATNIYDFTGDVVEDIPFLKTIYGVIIKVALTILVEILIAVVIFGFRTKYSIKVLLLVNLFTQILINVIAFNISTFGYILFYFIFIEPLIILIEYLLYRKLLRKEEHTVTDISVYTFIANVITALMIFII